MEKKMKGAWSYHEDPHGNMVPCASHPCRRHGKGDVIASSAEEACRIRYGSRRPQGMGAGGPRKARRAELGRIMDGFVAGKERDLSKAMTKTEIGLADLVEVGGRYAETRRMDLKQVAGLIGSDIGRLSKAGGIPKGWDATVSPEGSDGFRITVECKPGSDPLYRRISPDDICGSADGDGPTPEAVGRFREDTGKRSCSREEAAEYCRTHDYKVMTDQGKDTYYALKRIAGQYSKSWTSVRTMQSVRSRTSDIEINDGVHHHHDEDDDGSIL